MRQFIHHRVRRLADLLATSVRLQAELRAQAPAFEAHASAWLTECTKACDELGLQSQAATSARLETEFALVTRGIDARLMTRVDTYRRQFRQAGWSQAIGAAQAVLQEVHAAELVTLATAREQLGRMLVSGLQTGLIDDDKLSGARDEHDAEALWQTLLGSDQLGLLSRQLLLTIIDADAALLIAELSRRLVTVSLTQLQPA